MTDPVTAITASTIATLAFQEFVKSGAGELAKKFTTEAIAKMNALRQKIWDKLRGKPTAEKAIVAIQQGSSAELDRLVAYLEVAMAEDPAFADEIRLMAQEINAGKIQDNSSMTQNVHDQGTGIQAKAEGEATQYIAKEMHFHGKD
jgi:hypothetical protein